MSLTHPKFPRLISYYFKDTKTVKFDQEILGGFESNGHSLALRDD